VSQQERQTKGKKCTKRERRVRAPPLRFLAESNHLREQWGAMVLEWHTLDLRFDKKGEPQRSRRRM
jgi:hypothetical protein